MESWEKSEKWYSKIVGKEGHYYHQSVIFPALFKIFPFSKGISLLDVGCGQGVLKRVLREEVDYYGIDLSPSLIREAKKLSKGGKFFHADAKEKFPFEKSDFDAAFFILSLQNMEDQEKALFNTAQKLKKGGKLILALNHPCFRIPRQSSWEVDEKNKIQYRRINCYMSSLKIPIETHPGKGNRTDTTYSYHHPLSSYTKFLKKAKCSITLMEELISDKKSEGGKSRMENRAREEFPLFLLLVAEKD